MIKWSLIIEFPNAMKKCWRINKVPKYRTINVIHDNIIKKEVSLNSVCTIQSIIVKQ